MLIKPKISVIIPIYNVEKYIDRCIDSVRSQTFEDIEILCVDDCSPDGSYKLLEKHSAEDSRIRLIRHTKNMGLGGARNTALRVANADYIASVDSDDYMLPNMLQRLWDETDNGWFDVVSCGFNRVDGNGNIIAFQNYPAKSIVNEDNDINIFSTVNPAFWNKLWRKSLFTENDIFFPVKLYFEDMPTTPRLLSKAKYIKVIEDRLYQYFIRQDSITTSYSAKHILDYYEGFEVLLRFLEVNNLIERYEDEFIEYVNSNMRFHSDNVVASNMVKENLEQYLRHMLMFKITFLENRNLLKYRNLGDLLMLLKQRKLPSMLELKKKELSEIEKDKTNLLEEISKLQNLLAAKEQQVSKYRNLFARKEKEVLTFLELVYSRDQELIKQEKIIGIYTQEKGKISTEVLALKKQLRLSEEDNKRIKEDASIHQVQLVHIGKERVSLQADTLKYVDRIQVLELEKTELILCWQKVGVSMFGLFIKPFCTKKQYIKLRQQPRLFFKDSKSRVAKSVGSMLKMSSIERVNK